MLPLLLQIEATQSRAPAAAYARPAGPGNVVSVLRVTRPKPCPVSEDGDVVVCARRDDEQYRLRPLPPPPPGTGNFLSRPLRVTLAPGVSFGLQPGGGVGLKVKFGPGTKDDEKK
jgi:hypothetical protein